MVLKVFFNFKIVWTVHNFSAHNYPHPRIDALGRRVLLAFSDCIIVQQQATLSQYCKKYPSKKIYYVPHGNYVDVYGAPVARDLNLRKSLSFQDHDIVLLSFGAIAPYKLNEKIIDAVIAIRKEVPRLKLLIIGKGEAPYVETLARNISPDPGIIIRNTFVADKDIPRYFSIVDYSIFYYDRSEMTSGGIILSLSYGVPVVTRNIPASEIITDNNGYTYEDEQGLSSILKRLNQPFNKAGGHDMIENIREQDWLHSADQLMDIYARI